MWLDLLKWLSEQEDATTVAELQRQVNALKEYVEHCLYERIFIIIMLAVVAIFYCWWVSRLEKRIKKLEAALLEKRAD